MSQAPFRTHHHSPMETLLECRGPIDVVTVAEFRASLDHARRSGVPHLHVDLTDCPALDASAVAALAATTLSMRSAGARLTVTVPASAEAARILDYSGLDKLLAA